MSSWVLNIFTDGNPKTSLGNLCQCLIALTVNKYIPVFRWNFMSFSSCPLHLALSVATTKSPAPSPLLPPIRCVYIVELPQPLEPSLLWVEQFQLSQPSLYWKMLHSCNQSSLWHCTGLTPVSSYLSCTGGLRTGPSTSDVASMSSSVHLVRPQPVLVHGVIPPPIFRILHFFILNFMKLLLDHFSILLRFLWMAAWLLQLILDCLDGRMMLETTFPHFILPANLLRVCSAPSSRPLMKMLNSVGHSIDCVDTPLWTHLQQDFVPLVTTFWAIYSPSSLSTSLVLSDQVESWMLRNNHFLNSCRLDFLLKGRCSDNHFGFILNIIWLQAVPDSTDRENKETRIYCYKALICKSPFKGIHTFPCTCI